MEKLNVIRTDKETSEQELVTLDYAKIGRAHV